MRLFKYQPVARIKDFGQQQIRFSPCSDFNDPFEMRPPLSLFRSFSELSQSTRLRAEHGADHLIEVWKSEGKPLPSRESLIQRICEDEQKAINSQNVNFLSELNNSYRESLEQNVGKLGVLCLSEDPDNILMWSHYADKHYGFVMEFDCSHPFFGLNLDESNIAKLRPVKYPSSRPVLTYGDETNLTEWFFTKSQLWKYEKEWRAIRKRSIKDGLETYPVESLKSITFGALMKEEDQARLLGQLEELELPADFCLFEADLDQVEFKINRSPYSR